MYIRYLAPEMIKRHGHNHSIDYYCLGILLYELATVNKIKLWLLISSIY